MREHKHGLMQKTFSMLTAALMAAAMPLSSCHASAAKGGTMREMTTMEIVEDMGYGINLGNTFEACGDWIDQWGDGTPNAYETAWGSPTVTEAMIKGYAEAGFSTLRIPVAWSNMMEKDGQYVISAAYKSRVKQVVEWALDAKLYVVMNLHWDGGWLEEMPNNHDDVMQRYTSIWTQLCEDFKDYGDHLIFESQNEELGWSSLWTPWSGTQAGKERSFAYCNEVNQKFVDIVRASGGNNAKRHLLISGYNTALDHTCDSLFKMPNDPAGRCAVSVHYYSPAGFAILEEDADWGKATPTWGSAADLADLQSSMDMLKNSYVNKGIPVIIGEYGCPKKNKEPDSVHRFVATVCEYALKTGGICPVLWDVTDLHYDRSTCKMVDSALETELRAIGAQYTVHAPVEPDEPDPQPVIGDINGDGSISLADLVAMQRYLLADNAVSLADWQAGDMNGDGVLSAADMSLLKQRLITS